MTTRNDLTLEILIIDASTVARRALAELARQARANASITTADTIEQWSSTDPRIDPDLIVLSTGEPQTIRAAVTSAPHAKIIVLGLNGDPLYRDQALAAGADDYLPREQAPEKLGALIPRSTVEPTLIP